MTARRLRLVFFGTPEFAIPTLERLLDGPHPVVLVVSQPDRRRGRGRSLSPSPVAERAARADVPVRKPEQVGTRESAAEIARFAPDLGVVVAFGQFLPKRIRELPSLGYLINGHASLLPRHRGAAPVAHAVLAGDRETGVSVMRVEREMDAGPVALVRSTPIGPEESAGELSARLAVIAADALVEAIDRIAEGTVQWEEQDSTHATLAPRIDREDAHLHFEEPAAALVRRIRAMAPRPGAFTHVEGEPLRVLAARAEPGPVDGEPGSVRRTAEGGIRVATGDGWLVPLTLQRPGGRPLPAVEFLRGRTLPDGRRLGAS